MALMRRLLEDAQAKIRKMVEDNKALEVAAALLPEQSSLLQQGAPPPQPPLTAPGEAGVEPPPPRPRPLSQGSQGSQRSSDSASALHEAHGSHQALHDELADASRRLEELGAAQQQPQDTSGETSCGGGSSGEPAASTSSAPEPVAGCSTSEPPPGPAPSAHSGGSAGSSHPPPPVAPRADLEARRLREENSRLRAEVAELRALLGPEALELGAELQAARESLQALKADRKRLKAEKYDLLNQMKQLYGTLEDKEKELRDFIRNYEQQAQESEISAAALAAEREERERERWSLLRHARDEAERSLALAAQLTAREQQLRAAQEQLAEIRRQAGLDERVNGSGTPPGLHLLSGPAGPGGGPGGPGDRGSSADSGVRGSSDRESGATSAGGGNLSDSTTDGTPTLTVEVGLGGGSLHGQDIDAISVVSSIIGQHTYQSVTTPKDSPTLSPLSNPFARMHDAAALSRSVEQLQQQQQQEGANCSGGACGVVEAPRRKGAGRLGRGGTWGSISRVFARSRHRSKMASPSHDAADAEPYRSWSPLTEEGYAEKLRLLREASSMPMERWRAPTVLAWLEIALGMPQYGPRCAENVKSGKVLLELNDAELEAGLGITHPLHRKKLRLAIEEHRHPSLVRYPAIGQLGHTWVSSEWLPDLGLAQYSENFATNMVDARMLDHLSKKELEKMLGVTRKFHQASVVHGIHLLRMIKYDRQALAVRRHQSEHIDADPLVWTNQRFIRWARNIDLGEYADNLKDSGVHGALVVLEPSFSGDTMATALGIPPAKNIIRRHLATELEALILPARAAVEHYMRAAKAERREQQAAAAAAAALGAGRVTSRSYAGGLQHEEEAVGGLGPSELDLDRDKERTRRTSLRGSLSRALGLRVKSDLRRYRQQQQQQMVGRGPGECHSPDSLASPASEGPPCGFIGGDSEGGIPASSSSTSSGSRSHRRVRSIGDIEAAAAAAAAAVTPV